MHVQVPGPGPRLTPSRRPPTAPPPPRPLTLACRAVVSVHGRHPDLALVALAQHTPRLDGRRRGPLQRPVGGSLACDMAGGAERQAQGTHQQSRLDKAKGALGDTAITQEGESWA